MAERQGRWRVIVRSRRTACALTALWLIYSTIAVFLLITADTTQLRWIAGVQLVCGLAAAGCHLALARQAGKPARTLRDVHDPRDLEGQARFVTGIVDFRPGPFVVLTTAREAGRGERSSAWGSTWC